MPNQALDIGKLPRWILMEPPQNNERAKCSHELSVFPLQPPVWERLLFYNIQPSPRVDCTPLTHPAVEIDIHVVRQCDKDKEETVTALKLFVTGTYMGTM